MPIKGAKLYCLFCGAHILTFAVTIQNGDRVDAAMFELAEGQGPWHDGERTVCRNCHHSWWSGSFFLGRIR